MLFEDINKDFIAAFKAKEKVKTETLKMLKAAVNYVKIEKGIEEVPDEMVMEVVMKEVKKRKDSISQFEDAGRDDLAAGEKEELAILEAYMPEQMSEEEIATVVETTISEVGASGAADTGKVMGSLSPKLKGKADMGIVSKIVKEKLG